MKIFNLVCAVAVTVFLIRDVVSYIKNKEAWSAGQQKNQRDIFNAVVLQLIIILSFLDKVFPE